MVEFLLLILFCLSAVGYGSLFTPIFRKTHMHGAERFFYIFVLGLGVNLLFITIAAFLQLLTSLTLYSIFIPGFLLSVCSIYLHHKFDVASYVHFFKQNAFWVIVVFLLFVFSFFRSFIPPADNDSLQAYLYIAKLFSEHNGIYQIDFTIWDQIPQSS